MKGQGAVEYMIILAVVAILGLIIVGLLGGWPWAKESSAVEASQSYWASTDISLPSYSLHADGLVMSLQNNLDTNILVNNVTVGDVVNESATLALAPRASGVTSVGQLCTIPGEKFDFSPVLISYTDLSTGADYTLIGDVPLRGVCS